MRFVDRINYLFLELAECIALGYEPREEWLIEALNEAGQAEAEAVESGYLPRVGPPAPDEPPGSDIGPVEEAKKPVEDGEPCCGHPGNDQCCEAVPPAPPATEGEQRKKQQRRRPPRPRIPQTDDNIPTATPDRRFDPSAIAERARAKRQRDE
jgi:hypothetical protein